MVDVMHNVLAQDIPMLMDELPREEQLSQPAFGAEAPALGWAISADKSEFDQLFHSLGPSNSKLDGGACMPLMQQSGCSVDTLRQIWELADMDHDGFLDVDEFAVAMYLCKHKLAPAELPAELVPPSRR